MKNRNNSLISIIIPIYKVEQYLDHCIESVVGQTYSNLEIILVDDGSPDNCPAICDAWAEKDARIKVIHKKNGGLSDARNTGLEQMTGEFVTFVDSDDYVNRHYIEYMQKALEETGANLVVCGMTRVEPDAEINNSEAIELTIEDYSEKNAMDVLVKTDKIDDRRFVYVMNKLYKTELIKGIAFQSVLAEDRRFNIDVFVKNPSVCLISNSLYYYVQRGDSIVHNQEKRMCFLGDWISSIEYELEKLAEYGYESTLIDALGQNLSTLAHCQADARKAADGREEEQLYRERFVSIYDKYSSYVKKTAQRRKLFLARRMPSLYIKLVGK